MQYFRPSLRQHLSLRHLFCLFLSGRLRHVLLYTYLVSYLILVFLPWSATGCSVVYDCAISLTYPIVVYLLFWETPRHHPCSGTRLHVLRYFEDLDLMKQA